jgi:hypothetical protein
LKTNRKWLYLSDELEIDHTADDERLKEVLNELGRDEMFDKLWDEATAKVEQPSPPQKEIRLTDLQREMDEFQRSLDITRRREEQRREKRRKANLTKFLDW